MTGSWEALKAPCSCGPQTTANGYFARVVCARYVSTVQYHSVMLTVFLRRCAPAAAALCITQQPIHAYCTHKSELFPPFEVVACCCHLLSPWWQAALAANATLLHYLPAAMRQVCDSRLAPWCAPSLMLAAQVPRGASGAKESCQAQRPGPSKMQLR